MGTEVLYFHPPHPPPPSPTPRQTPWGEYPVTVWTPSCQSPSSSAKVKDSPWIVLSKGGGGQKTQKD
jgi:rubredoxin